MAALVQVGTAAAAPNSAPSDPVTLFFGRLFMSAIAGSENS